MIEHTICGVTRSLTGWAKFYRIHYNTFHMRVATGWGVNDALQTPIRTPLSKTPEVVAAAESSGLSRQLIVERMRKKGVTAVQAAAIGKQKKRKINVGDRFGNIVVIHMNTTKYIRVKCDCGAVVTKPYSTLRGTRKHGYATKCWIGCTGC